MGIIKQLEITLCPELLRVFLRSLPDMLLQESLWMHNAAKDLAVQDAAVLKGRRVGLIGGAPPFGGADVVRVVLDPEFSA